MQQVEIMECPGSMGFGLKARVDIKEEERVLEIPSSLFFSKEKVMSVEMEGLVRLEPLLTAMPNLVLALLLLNERYSQTSFWKPYISEEYFDSLKKDKKKCHEIENPKHLVHIICLPNHNYIIHECMCTCSTESDTEYSIYN